MGESVNVDPTKSSRVHDTVAHEVPLKSKHEGTEADVDEFGLPKWPVSRAPPTTDSDGESETFHDAEDSNDNLPASNGGSQDPDRSGDKIRQIASEKTGTGQENTPEQQANVVAKSTLR